MPRNGDISNFNFIVTLQLIDLVRFWIDWHRGFNLFYHRWSFWMTNLIFNNHRNNFKKLLHFSSRTRWQCFNHTHGSVDSPCISAISEFLSKQIVPPRRHDTPTSPLSRFIRIWWWNNLSFQNLKNPLAQQKVDLKRWHTARESSSTMFCQDNFLLLREKGLIVRDLMK